MFFIVGVLKNFAQYSEEYSPPMLESLSNKSAGLQAVADLPLY